MEKLAGGTFGEDNFARGTAALEDALGLGQPYLGHLNAELLLWMFSKGIMVLYTPLGGSWLNMSESIQRILVRRALAGEHPRKPEQIIEWLEAVARGWNRDPTPFEWGGCRALRRVRARKRRHALGGSGAYTRKPIRRPSSIMEKWRHTSQVTH